jgi:hypothetical protein
VEQKWWGIFRQGEELALWYSDSLPDVEQQREIRGWAGTEIREVTFHDPTTGYAYAPLPDYAAHELEQTRRAEAERAARREYNLDVLSYEHFESCMRHWTPFGCCTCEHIERAAVFFEHYPKLQAALSHNPALLQELEQTYDRMLELENIFGAPNYHRLPDRKKTFVCHEADRTERLVVRA